MFCRRTTRRITTPARAVRKNTRFTVDTPLDGDDIMAILCDTGISHGSRVAVAESAQTSVISMPAAGATPTRAGCCKCAGRNRARRRAGSVRSPDTDTGTFHGTAAAERVEEKAVFGSRSLAQPSTLSRKSRVIPAGGAGRAATGNCKRTSSPEPMITSWSSTSRSRLSTRPNLV